MNMASVGIVLIYTIICVTAGKAEAAFLNVECKDEEVGQHGQQSLLECIVKTPHYDAEIRVVTWKKDGAALLVFNRGETKLKQGYSFAEASWNVRNMNVSLLITNTSVAHQGEYTCMVVTDRGDNSNRISLKVRAKYSKPVIHSNPEKMTRNTAGTLTCESEGGYPKGELRWFDEHNKTKSSQMEATPTESGLFHLTSKLELASLKQGSISSKYTCTVFNASGGREDEEQIVVLDSPKPRGQDQLKEGDPTTRIVAPVVVIGSLIVGLLLALLIYRRRSQQARRHSTAPLMGDHHGVRTYESDVEEGDLQEMDKTCKDNHA